MSLFILFEGNLLKTTSVLIKTQIAIAYILFFTTRIIFLHGNVNFSFFNYPFIFILQWNNSFLNFICIENNNLGSCLEKSKRKTVVNKMMFSLQRKHSLGTNLLCIPVETILSDKYQLTGLLTLNIFLDESNQFRNFNFKMFFKLYKRR